MTGGGMTSRITPFLLGLDGWWQWRACWWSVISRPVLDGLRTPVLLSIWEKKEEEEKKKRKDLKNKKKILLLSCFPFLLPVCSFVCFFLLFVLLFFCFFYSCFWFFLIYERELEKKIINFVFFLNFLGCHSRNYRKEEEKYIFPWTRQSQRVFWIIYDVKRRR